ncbi:S-layer homology domain-containing protein [Selenihalanaerobacter shriftii]|uniref:S-layer homology domain-containing protein n=1 Tax=Selenihalanaerobacter shriftii TaxID=142842 RepID=A0A1T4JLV0_9FIRM|nr:S-layer homology domain-containing protein [Selenihalanaerobacter shriftii]SJZ31103.1 S-layer homology domain-containing protein [Selenihalanaerobacter shriftii]
MKKLVSLGIILVLVLTLTIPAFASEKIKDISNDHWAYRSVNELVEKGLMSLYEDNTFKGEKEVTRYQLAEVVAKVLVTIDEGKVKASEEDVNTLRKLSTEFRTELVEINKKTDIFAKRIQDLEEKAEVTEEDIVSTKGELMEVRKQVKQMIQDLNNVKEFKSSINARIAMLERKNYNLSNRVEALENQLHETKVENEELRSDSKNKLLIGGGILLLGLLAN